MSNHRKAIKQYYFYLSNLDVSPYETMNLLDIRDYLHEKFTELDKVEQSLVEHLDHFFHLKATQIYDHISKVYNFQNSADIPPDKWWWHLDSYKELSAGIDAIENIKPFKNLLAV